MWKENADVDIASKIADLIDEPIIVSTYYLIAEVIDSDGEIGLAVSCAPGQRSATTLGLLEVARLNEGHCLIYHQTHREDDDGA